MFYFFSHSQNPYFNPYQQRIPYPNHFYSQQHLHPQHRYNPPPPPSSRRQHKRAHHYQLHSPNHSPYNNAKHDPIHHPFHHNRNNHDRYGLVPTGQHQQVYPYPLNYYESNPYEPSFPHKKYYQNLESTHVTFKTKNCFSTLLQPLSLSNFKKFLYA